MTDTGAGAKERHPIKTQIPRSTATGFDSLMRASALGKSLSLTALALLLAFSGCNTIGGFWLHQTVKAELTEAVRTKHFVLRFRPSGNVVKSAANIGAVAERELARICAALEVRNDESYTFFLFEDAQDFRATTKMPEPVAGFANRGAVFVVFDDQQAMIHELVHLVVHAKIGESKSLAKTEGLANALLESSHGLQVHAWAKYYRATGQLPSLSTLLTARDLSPAADPDRRVNVYDIAASWMRFILETYGAAGLKQYYLEHDPEKIFARPLASVEQAWLAKLDAYSLRPEVSALLATRHGVVSPDGLVLNPGESLTLVANDNQALAQGSNRPPARFQWSKDGREIPSATAPKFELLAVKDADGGVYTVTERDETGNTVGTTSFVLRVIDRSITSTP